MIVVDTNIIAHFYLKTDFSEQIDRIFEEEDRWAAPVIWKSEFRSVLTQHYHHDLISGSQAIEIFELAEKHLAKMTFEVDVSLHFQLVKQSACSSYDIEFVALATELKTELVTMDKKVLAEFPEIAIHPSNFLKAT